ncbi:hypothetical protein [Algibacter sp. L1A34]|uniref:hypothetical protein n=1 Tax=Algibacter sp. L1A34 TaxID=2686365 RepID=UPI00131B54F6|nr:hypothetical protein [Algibacter sp. L1A34]
MEFTPNNTIIKAAVVDVLNENDEVKIVILELPKAGSYPGFLSVGKLLIAKIIDANNTIGFKVEDVISAEIEVLGGPLKQVFLLHNVSKQF